VDYFSGRCADGYVDYRASGPVLRREFARTVAFIRNFIAHGRLLELGCAYGFFLQEARPFFEVAGIELAEDAATYCRNNGLNVLSGVADEGSCRDLGKMDVIVLLDVIEHVPNPRETLALCERHLNPSGIIVLTTGDFASLVARLSGRAWRLMTPPQHLWFFTPESVRCLARSLEMEMEACDHPWRFVPLSLILFQLRRMLHLSPAGGAAGSGIGIPVNLLDAMRIVLRKPKDARTNASHSYG
jgi:SAM-dependent methyltransferase